MKNAPQAYPLAWPAGRPRRAPERRQPGQFRSGRHPVTVSEAINRLEGELDRLGAIYVVVSTNIEPRLDGRPRSGQPEPRDPGVVAYFQLKGEPYALACDTYQTVPQNLAALAAHVEATRAITRYGVASAQETLQAFSALPPPDRGPPPPRPWHEVLGLPANILDALGHGAAARGAIEAAYKEVARASHPDAGGSTEAMAEVNRARDEAMTALMSEPV